MRKYFVWKDKNCNGINFEWIEMSGKEFYRFSSKPENAGRRFIVLDDRFNEGADVITIEATENEYRKWKKEHNHEQYLDRAERERETVSLYDTISMHEELTFEDVIADEDSNVEETAIRQASREIYKKVLAQLSDEEKRLVEFFFVINRSLSENQNAAKYGIPQTTLNYKKLAIRKRLRELLKKNGICM